MTQTNCPRCGYQLAQAPKPLTKCQATLLAYIRTFIGEKGYAPTYTEIAEACGYRSLSTVHEHLQNLERKGHITRRYNEERSIALVDAPAAAVVS
jgi:repressor LexA